MDPTFDEQVDIWRYAYARSSMNEATDSIKRLLANAGLDQGLRRALTYSAVICYARPFTKCQVSSNLRLALLHDAPPVPAPLEQTHRDYLEVRNKLVGHKDATPGPGRNGHPNVVHLAVDANGFNLHTTEFTISAPVLAQLGELAAFFIAHCEANLVPLMNKFKAELRALGPGTYNVAPVVPPASWIQPVPPLASPP
jgi:hypothetical protein